MSPRQEPPELAGDGGAEDGDSQAWTGAPVKSVRREAFWSTTRHACLPLAIWAGHFFTAYGFVAIGCRAGLDASGAFGVTTLTLVLMALTVAALAWLAMIVLATSGMLHRRANGSRRQPDLPPGAGAFRRGAALLSLVAVAWTTAPVLLFPSCLQ